jgi:hypothetical protein
VEVVPCTGADRGGPAGDADAVRLVAIGIVTAVSDKFEFLSMAWIDAARAIRDEYEGRVPPPPVALRMNQVITDAPDGTIEAHLDTSEGRTRLELGHVENPDLTVTTDYATAKAVFALGDPAAAMQAFMAGRIRIEGDMAKLLALQSANLQPDPLAAEVTERVRAITAD